MLTNANRTLQAMLCFAFVFFAIFGVKVSYLDLSVLLPALVLVFCIAVKRLLNFDRKLLFISGLLVILLIYQTAVRITHSSFDLNSLLRLVRALLISILLSAMVASNIFSGKQILASIFYSLLLHAVLINAAAVFDPLNNFLSLLSGNDRVRPLRASGLLAGFDISGLLCLFGLLMILLKVHRPATNTASTIYCMIFMLGCFFTSRVSMVLAVIFICIFGLQNIVRANLHFFSKLMLLLATTTVGYLLVSTYIAPIFEVTFSLGLLDVEDELRVGIQARHAVQSENSFLWLNMFYLPPGSMATIFGTGIEELNTDVGYIKDIYRYGIIGLLFSLLIYLYIFSVGKLNFKRTGNQPYSKMLSMIFLLIFLLTFKNNYLFTRAVFPLTLLMVCVSITIRRERAPVKAVQPATTALLSH